MFEILTFSPTGKRWDFDPEREKRINKQIVTSFKKISDLTGNKIPLKTLALIERIAGIGEVVVIRIEKNNRTVADFTIFMDKNDKFKMFEEAELFANQIGIFIERVNISKKLLEKEEQFDFIVAATGTGTWDWDLETNKVYYSPQWKKMLNY